MIRVSKFFPVKKYNQIISRSLFDYKDPFFLDKQLTDDDVDFNELLYTTDRLNKNKAYSGEGEDEDEDDDASSFRTSGTGDETDYDDAEIVEVVGEDEIDNIEIFEKVKHITCLYCI